MDGLQLAQQIKASSPTTPILCLTGWGTQVDEDSTRAAAFDTILSKPPRLAELMSALAKAGRLVAPAFVREAS
jgi:CheY-like chemotaxis protein